MAKKENNAHKIEGRLVKASIRAAVVPIVAAAVAVVVLAVIAVVYSRALVNYGFAQGDMGKTMTYFAEARSALRGVIGYDDQAAIESVREAHADNLAKFQESFAVLEKYMTSAANEASYEEISANLPAYWALEEEILELGSSEDITKKQQAQEMMLQELTPMYNEINDELVAMMDARVTSGNSMSEIMTVVSVVLVIVILVAIVVALILAIRKGRQNAIEISGPLVQLDNRLQQFANGDITSPFPTADTKDEVADMIESANKMAQSLNFIIGDMHDILGKMADSDYTVRSQDRSRYIGGFKKLFEAALDMKTSMVETIRLIEESSAQVSTGSSNLSATSMNIAEGANEQASAVEELQITVGKITTASERAAKAAQAAYDQSRKYTEMAHESNDDMKEMVRAMERINETSKRIGNIISEIEDIASQTNLLSLNASIEAARAGEAGRGFAVVADEIRKLAEQCSKSAVDIRSLIEGALQEIDNGNHVADRAVESLTAVVDGIGELAAASRELSDISTSQTVIVKEAEKGINQISEVIQTNAAVAQQSSATSEELSAQAVSLDNLISKFILPEEDQLQAAPVSGTSAGTQA